MCGGDKTVNPLLSLRSPANATEHGRGLRECIDNVDIWDPQAGADSATFIGLLIVCLMCRSGKDGAIDSPPRAARQRRAWLAAGCPTALRFLWFHGNVDETSATKRRKTIALRQNVACSAGCLFTRYWRGDDWWAVFPFIYTAVIKIGCVASSRAATLSPYLHVKIFAPEWPISQLRAIMVITK